MTLSIEVLILIITLVVTIVFHIIFICIGYKERRFQRFHDVTQRILDIGISIKDFKKKQYPLWDNAILNEAEYISYLINKEKLDYKLLSGFLDTALISYFDGILKSPEHKEDLTNEDYYPEFKKLYNRLRADKNKYY